MTLPVQVMYFALNKTHDAHFFQVHACILGVGLHVLILKNVPDFSAALCYSPVCF